MKILHLICTDGISGAEKHIKYLLPGLVSKGMGCHLMIICPTKSERVLTAFCDDLRSKGVTTVLICAERAIRYPVLKKVSTYLKENNILNVHSHLFRSDLLAALLKQFFNPKLFIVSTRHGYQESVLTDYSPGNYKVPKNAYYYLTKYFLGRIDKNISISHCISQMFLDFKLTSEYFPVIYHGVEVGFDPNAAIADFDFNKPSLVVVGRLEIYKGHKFVIEALKIARQTLPDIQLYLVGEGSAKAELIKQAADTGLGNDVHFLGFRSNALSYMHAADIVVIPSLFEPFGLVFIEALGLQKCIVAFDVPAGNEILSDQSAGLVQKENADQMAATIIYYLSDREERSRLEDNALKLFSEKFTTQKMVDDTAAFYSSIGI